MSILLIWMVCQSQSVKLGKVLNVSDRSWFLLAEAKTDNSNCQNLWNSKVSVNCVFLWCCRNALFVVICFVVSFRLRWGLIVTVRAGHDHTIAHGKLPVSSVSRGIVVFDNTGFGKFVDQTCSPLLTAVSPVRCLVVCINPRQYKLPTSLYILPTVSRAVLFSRWQSCLPGDFERYRGLPM